MALISAATANTASNASRTGCTYINTLISGATDQGVNFVRVDNKYIDTNILTLLANAGYQVTTSYTDMGTYVTYVITW